MNRIHYLTLLLIFPLAVIVSCKKQDTGKTLPGGDAKPAAWLQKVINGDFITELAYNADSTVKSITYRNGQDKLVSNILFYYQDKKLIRAEEPGYRFTYKYEGNHVSEILFSDRTDHVYQRYRYTYTGDDVAETIAEAQINGELKLYYRNTYEYAQPGNESKSEYFIYEEGKWSKTGEKRTTAYDDHRNYNSWLDTYPYLISTRNRGNNPLKTEYRTAAGIVTQTNEYNYTYDAAGKPLTIKQVTTEANNTSFSNTSTLLYF